ncbi:MAG: cyanase [Solirubrobacterales bacterium]|nr:cyanase [Solirubrobacterales bacterium]
MTRADLTERILEAKRRQDLSFGEIASRIGRDRVWLTAALLGQHPLDREAARAVLELLGLGSADEEALLTEVPTRGSGVQAVPTDPTLYRLYEVLGVYGPALKALIHEEFGDGIMSAIAFNLALERREDPDGDRVRITLDGKFLPYKW